MHLSYRSLPELRELPRDQQQRLWEACRWKAWRHWQVWLAQLAGVAMVVLGVLSQNLLLACVAGGIAGLFWGQSVLAFTRPYIRARLNPGSSSVADA